MRQANTTILMTVTVVITAVLFMMAPPFALPAMFIGGVWIIHNDLQEVIRRLPPRGE